MIVAGAATDTPGPILLERFDHHLGALAEIRSQLTAALAPLALGAVPGALPHRLRRHQLEEEQRTARQGGILAWRPGALQVCHGQAALVAPPSNAFEPRGTGSCVGG
jgi:hypothetical protein